MSTFVKRIKDQRGVTLIELLAVIVILGIIAAVAVPAVMNNFDNARENSDLQTIAIVTDAVQRALLDNVAINTDGTTDNNISILVNNGYLTTTPSWSSGTPLATFKVTATGAVTVAGQPTY